MDVKTHWLRALVVSGAIIGLVGFISQAQARHGELPNRIAEPAPYNLQEAGFFGGFTGHAPPFENDWNTVNNPGQCSGCHDRIFSEWNGSMMANAWRDPAWQAVFLLTARATATDGCGDVLENLNAQGQALDGTEAYACNDLNPFAIDGTSSRFNLGGGATSTTTESGSLFDDFCSRCHMPTNYVDAVPLAGVNIDDLGDGSNFEHAAVIPNYDPTSSNGTNRAYATVIDSAQSLYRNTQSGKRGIFCAVCHTNAESKRTPYSTYVQSGVEYIPSQGSGSRSSILGNAGNVGSIPDANSPNLGYGIGAGAWRLSPNAINRPARFGPIWNGAVGGVDPYISDVFDTTIANQDRFAGGGGHGGRRGGGGGGGHHGGHEGYYHVKFERSEFCGACHDVTNPVTILNPLDKWVGGFPIERTYTEWSNSRYADRIDPATGRTQANFDPAFKRDCQTCHMQQDFGQPGTTQTLYSNGRSIAPLRGVVGFRGPVRDALYTHHFVGGNAYVTNLLGATVDTGGGGRHGGGGSSGAVQPYPVLSSASFTSASSGSKFHWAYYNSTGTGTPTHHSRMAWDRLRNSVSLDLSAAVTANAGDTVGISTLTVTNDGSGHNFPTGFPEGRISWVAVRAFDTATGAELDIHDSVWDRTSTGVGYFTTEEMVDPNFPGCDWSVRAGSPDPYARIMRAVATLGDGCPTLALAYATAVNIVTNDDGVPIDASGVAIDRNNPRGIPQYVDVDGDGDLFDDSFLIDTRLSPLPLAAAVADLSDRYSVIIPANAVGPIAVTAAMYYQSLEAIIAEEFLGNLANTDLDQESAAYLADPANAPLPVLEPCVLKGLCDGGRTPSTEPAVVEGAPPVPMEVKSWVINLAADNVAPSVTETYPANGASSVYSNFVAKVTFNEPVTGVDNRTFTLVDSRGLAVPAFVDQIGDGTWALFAHDIFLRTGSTYTARLAAGICDFSNNCSNAAVSWSFQTATSLTNGRGDTSVPLGFATGQSAALASTSAPATTTTVATTTTSRSRHGRRR